mmetsp:Transcript_44478/g.141709  ORF Transcript_44478/g.141709 Transcript_44478/m.141709 type:complete len:410 (+) Transcript_44478:209-1438(+)
MPDAKVQAWARLYNAGPLAVRARRKRGALEIPLMARHRVRVPGPGVRAEGVNKNTKSWLEQDRPAAISHLAYTYPYFSYVTIHESGRALNEDGRCLFRGTGCWPASPAGHPELTPGLVLHSADHVGRHRHVNPLGVGKAEVRHQLDEVLARLREPGVELLLLGHGRHAAALVVVPRVDERLRREREDLRVDGVVEPASVALLEVAASAAPDQQGVAREDHRRLLRHPQDVAHAAIGVPGGGPHLQLQLAEGDAVAVPHVLVRAGTRGGGDDRLHRRPLLADRAAGGDVVSVAVRVDHVLQREAELVEGVQVAVLLLQHRVDQHGLPTGAAADDVGQGAGVGVEELLHHGDACGRVQHGRVCVALLGELLHDPLAHGAADRTPREELQVHVRGELHCGLHRVPAPAREPE